MNLSNRIIAHLDDFVQSVAEGQHLPQQKFIWEMLYGMINSGSVVLADIARHLEPDKELIQIEKRLSRNLQSLRLEEDELRAEYLAQIANRITRQTTLALDLGDIRKKYATQMENLCEMWDGSEGETATGYWLVEIEAHHCDGKRTGVYWDCWSQEANDFTSRNRVILQAVKQVSAAFNEQGLWVGDRGLDGEVIISGLDALSVRYVIRQTGDRHVQTEASGRAKSVRQVTNEVKLCGRLEVWHRRKDGQWEKKHLRYGWREVIWGQQQKRYTLVVIVGWGVEPLMLWTNISVQKRKSALLVIKSFMRRWAVEDGGRVLKQEFDLEKVRVASWLSLRRTVILAGLAYGFICLVHDMGQQMVAFLISLVRAFRPPKKVWAYRIRQGLAELWEGGLLFRPSNFG
jgi:hypothetical protein